MITEDKTLEIIIVSDKAFDLSKLNTDKHSLSNVLTGEGRKNFIETIKNDQELKTSTDLIIRLNGSKSLDNSVIAEACYAEIFFSEKDEKLFSQKDLEKAIEDFFSRKRNFGV